jgi:hypothetical protein
MRTIAMTDTYPEAHSHIFLGAGHEKNERRTWMVIWLCGFMMIAEIIGGHLVRLDRAGRGRIAHVDACERVAAGRAGL